MGIEYNINFSVPENFDFQAIKKCIDNPKDKNGWHAFELELTKAGFYFCDNCWSKQSSIAFRKLVDEALMHSEKVEIDNL